MFFHFSLRARTLGKELIQVGSSGDEDGNPRSASKKRGRMSKDSPGVGGGRRARVRLVWSP